ncbi:tRNA (uridine(34)/cytosine(34)/5-carboxymethylaminomethyluridine(34)-2'-O)-methyltransferase TrmL [Chromobacterium violaceum]|uniref:tRNA (cytidine(34)-2'-O)-methyltransferase n=2 Tax=Chromobacterium violaceum TaxID=536 RepID=Q7NPV9_CHRVO|nr:tRNA (uridine(34)/cytosine(34)/5-carboxymethylaminomethyluridine(34)-2'-O)-methyltransferase TrmL [Chromobacterium violaceum]AAQ62042.1 probable RNA methyltransferase [Chromobacterium violaceum ATCC 12472]ATP30543.1 tRNA (uridine(34)/cytosine(34)/5-carboxymethylaminomethyluridine(34)-2'-O)-methyltransferase TrmL [Chromobacterium violaceum]ATP34452.1 tRNA (uridine(34)/cytosine(34)/5-carboxymethylaminomethyluridine(34)-2'-O)-methyltransferase TrmL [Chromobacterium violaceum]KJH69249.1 rRNA met
MFTVVLFQPEIPPNTGNVIRLCANTGCELHLVKPMGFPLEDAKLRRAGLDYHEYARVVVHEDWDACLRTLQGRRIFAATTKGATRHDRISYQPGDVFLFGPESRGLPQDVLAALPAQQRIRLPMRPESRSLNLSNAVAVTVFEAWRQLGFEGGV